VKILKTLILMAEDGAILACDTIEHEGKLWLVPEWLEGPIAGTERPARIIGLHGLPLQKPSPNYQADYSLPIPLSRDTLAGGTEQGLDVIEAPEIVRTVGPSVLH
jgi:hypothetical protein